MTTVFSAWRWCLVARGLGIELPLRTAIADYYRALFVNAALPSGILGDVHRAVRNGKDSGDVGRGVRAVVLERFAGQVVLITFGVTVLLSHPALAHHVNLPRASVAIIGVALVSPAGRALGPPPGRRLAVGRGLRTGMTDARRGLLARNRWPLLVLSSAIVVAGHLAMFVVAARAAGSHAPFLRLLPLMMLALFAMTLPVNIGGWGPREGVTAWAFGAAGLGATQGLTIAVLYGLFAFIAALPGVVVIVGQWLARLAVARAARSDPPSGPESAESRVSSSGGRGGRVGSAPAEALRLAESAGSTAPEDVTVAVEPLDRHSCRRGADRAPIVGDLLTAPVAMAPAAVASNRSHHSGPRRDSDRPHRSSRRRFRRPAVTTTGSTDDRQHYNGQHHDRQHYNGQHPTGSTTTGNVTSE